MQPPPDAVSEFKVVTNNKSAEYGRSAGATVNVAYRSGTNQLHGSGWEFHRDTALNATRLLQAGRRRQAAVQPQSVRRRGRRPDRARTRRSSSATTKASARTRRQVDVRHDCRRAPQRAGVLTVATSAIRAPASSTRPARRIPMTAFARKVLGGLPDAEPAGTANNYSVAAAVHQRHEQGRRQSRPAGQPDAVARSAGTAGATSSTDDTPSRRCRRAAAATATSTRATSSSCSARRYVPSGSSLLEIRFGWSNTQGGKNPPALGTASALDAYGIAGLPTDPRIAGGLPSQLITGFSALGRQATNPQWQYPTVWNPKVNYTWTDADATRSRPATSIQHIDVEVQDVNPLYGRDTYAGQFTRPAGAAASNLYNLADFMLGLRSQYALSNVLVAELRQDMHFAYLQDDSGVNDRADAEPRRFATSTRRRCGRSTTSCRTTIPTTRHDGRGQETGRSTTARWWIRIATTSGRASGFAYTLIAEDGRARRLGRQLRPLQPHRRGEPAADQRPAGRSTPSSTRRIRRIPTFRADRAGLSGGPHRSVAVQPAAGNITYIPRDFHSSQVQSWYASVQREFGPSMLLDVAYVGNTAERPAAARQLQPGGAEQRRRHDSAAGAAADSGILATSPTSFNGGKSRYNALADQSTSGGCARRVACSAR